MATLRWWLMNLIPSATLISSHFSMRLAQKASKAQSKQALRPVTVSCCEANETTNVAYSRRLGVSRYPYRIHQSAQIPMLIPIHTNCVAALPAATMWPRTTTPLTFWDTGRQGKHEPSSAEYEHTEEIMDTNRRTAPLWYFVWPPSLVVLYTAAMPACHKCRTLHSPKYSNWKDFKRDKARTMSPQYLRRMLRYSVHRGKQVVS